MNIKNTLALGLIAASLSAPAAAAVIDFTTAAPGAVTTIGAATFSLAGVGEAGNPTVAFGGDGVYLWNSTDGASYPTNDILRVTFAGGASNLKFDLNPFGLNGEADQGWSIYDAADVLLASGGFTSGSLASYDLSSYSGVARLDLNNGANNWLQGLARISFDTGTVPVPATPALVLVAALAMAAVRRSRAA